MGRRGSSKVRGLNVARDFVAETKGKIRPDIADVPEFLIQLKKRQSGSLQSLNGCIHKDTIGWLLDVSR